MFNTLVQMGYYPICQVKEKRYKLDFVLIENGKKLQLKLTETFSMMQNVMPNVTTI
ncbi:hypothetical protein AAHB94_00965 [Bacillus toyonensis]